MDIISHGLYGGVVFGRKSRFSYWKAFLWGVLPDLCSFGILFVLSTLSIVSGPDWESGPPDPSSIPNYVHRLYDITHSLVMATVIIGLFSFLTKRFMIEMLAWPLHILVDISSHSSAFFPTPFLWPLSDYTFNGISWSNPIIYIPNLIILTALYIHFYISKRKKLAEHGENPI